MVAGRCSHHYAHLMATLVSPPPVISRPAGHNAPLAYEEGAVVIPGSWELYCQLYELFERQEPRPRVALCGAFIEIMPPPSFEHESSKSSIGCFVEQFCLERNIDFHIAGATEHRDEGLLRGKEPDESYFIGREAGPDAIPDLMIEIKVTSGGLDRLQIWHPFDVTEVWVYEKGTIRGFAHEPENYVEVAESRVLPGIPLRLIGELVPVRPTSQAIREFRRRLA
jgi:Uma2 family endonuclease